MNSFRWWKESRKGSKKRLGVQKPFQDSAESKNVFLMTFDPRYLVIVVFFSISPFAIDLCQPAFLKKIKFLAWRKYFLKACKYTIPLPKAKTMQRSFCYAFILCARIIWYWAEIFSTCYSQNQSSWTLLSGQ